MSLRRIFVEFKNLKDDEKLGRMSVPCRIVMEELDPFVWKLYFDLEIDGCLLDTVEAQVRFGSTYAFNPPIVRIVTPGYRQIMICFKDWSPFIGMSIIIPHIYFSIIDHQYYKESFSEEEEKEEKSQFLSGAPSQESEAPQSSYHLKD